MTTTSDLTTLSLISQSQGLKEGAFSSVELTEALLAKADASQEKLNAFTEILRDSALKAAEDADARRQAGEPLSELDGTCVSLKENVALQGKELTLGLLGRKGRIASHTAGVARLLLDAGIHPIGRTNLSQGMLFHESRNPVFGQTQNPHDLTRTPGGSSGGEGAAIAAFCSPAGVGTDIGGSVRVPAHFCGIAGLKPTLDRFPNAGIGSGVPGQEGIRSQAGPMAREVNDLAAIMNLLSGKRAIAVDGRVPPLAWGPKKDGPLKVGFFTHDGWVRPSAACARAVETAAGLLRDRGHQVVEYAPPHQVEIVERYLNIMSADGGRSMMRNLQGDAADPSLGLNLRLVRLPKLVRRNIARLMGLTGEDMVKRLLGALEEKAVVDLYQIVARVRELAALVHADWIERELDIVLCPPHATVALKHGDSRDFALGGSFSFRYNVLDRPAGVLPICRVQEDEAARANAVQRPEKRAALIDAGSAGLPVGVQVVGMPFAEESVLSVMAELEQCRPEQDFSPANGG